MIKKLISKNQNRRLIFFNRNKQLNNQKEEIKTKTITETEKEYNKTLKTETKEL